MNGREGDTVWSKYNPNKNIKQFVSLLSLFPKTWNVTCIKSMNSYSLESIL